MNRLSDPISMLAVAYLATPAFVFVLGWMELPPGLAVAALLSVAICQLNTQLPCRPLAHGRSAWIYLLILACIWAAFSGGAHFFYANTDWRTRDSVYADLILSAWPPSYGLQDGTPLVLRTAMGYFLPPALLASLAGIRLAPAILFAWTAIGIALFLLLIPSPRRFGWRLFLVGLLVVFFSGMDYPAIVLIHGHLPIFPLPLEWWRAWTYTSLTGQLFWAPNHALALWIGTALFYRHRSDSVLPALGLVLLPLLLLWTPFAVIGLLPWFFWGIARAYPSARFALLGTTPVQWMLAVILATIVIALFSRSGSAVSYALAEPVSAAAPPGGMFARLDQAAGYIQFVAFEFGLLVLLLRPRLPEMRQALTIAASVLLLLPLIRIGPSNDWLLRVSTPSLLILMLLTLAELDIPSQEIRHSLRTAVLIGVLALGAVTPIFEFSRAILWPRTPPNYSQSLIEQQLGFVPPHYVGHLDLPLLRVLFRSPSPVPEAAQRQNLLPQSMRRPP